MTAETINDLYAAATANVQNGVQWYITGVAGTNALTGTLPAPFTGYVAGQMFHFFAPALNTGPMTININGVGAVNITKKGAVALSPGDVPANGAVIVMYDGVEMQIISGGGGSGGGATGAGKDAVFQENERYTTGNYVIGQGGQVACTVSIATPAVVTQANTYVGGEEVFFSTTGALPTGLSALQTYYVSTTGLSNASFQVSATRGGASINTSGTQSGSHTCGKAKSAMAVGPITYTGATTIPGGQRLVVF